MQFFLLVLMLTSEYTCASIAGVNHADRKPTGQKGAMNACPLLSLTTNYLVKNVVKIKSLITRSKMEKSSLTGLEIGSW